MATEDKLWLPPLSPKDQQKLDRLRRKGKKSTSNWTGFAGRTLWDWIQFFAVLAIPIIVAVGTLYFTQQITLQQAKLSISASEKQHQTDIQITNDQQQEATLKSYLDNMSDLLLNHNLRKSKPGDEVSQVARERTLTTLRRLGETRNKIVLQFLQDAHLIGVKIAVIDLSNADLNGDDLSGVNLGGTNLNGANLGGTNLDNANLQGANLDNASLQGANLQFANLQFANLRGSKLAFANLQGANLDNANLSNAILYKANLIDADLQFANLQDADLNGAVLRGTNLDFAGLDNANLQDADLQDAHLVGAFLQDANLDNANLIGALVGLDQLSQAKSLKDAMMPDGSIHP